MTPKNAYVLVEFISRNYLVSGTKIKQSYLAEAFCYQKRGYKTL